MVLASITAGRAEYNLEPFFYTPLGDAASVAYRHEVLRDLEINAVLAAVGEFTQGMRQMREHLAVSPRAQAGPSPVLSGYRAGVGCRRIRASPPQRGIRAGP